MNKTVLFLSLLFFPLSAILSAHEGTAHHAFCPVSGERASDKHTMMYEGKEYAFCCNKCKKEFKKDPKTYLAKMNAAEASHPQDHHPSS